MAKSPIQKIVIGDSPVHGQGVFAAVDSKKSDVIERCPYLVIDGDDLAEENRLNDYLFTSPDVRPCLYCLSTVACCRGRNP